MKFFSEFKEFAVKGNMVDIAIGVVVGTSFNKVVDVLVKDILLPPLLFLTDGAQWADRKLVLRDAVHSGAQTMEEISIGYGSLIESLVDFLVITFTVFVIVKLMNSLRRKSDDTENSEVPTPKDIQLLDEIKELLTAQNELLAKAKRDL